MYRTLYFWPSQCYQAEEMVIHNVLATSVIEISGVESLDHDLSLGSGEEWEGRHSCFIFKMSLRETAVWQKVAETTTSLVA